MVEEALPARPRVGETLAERRRDRALVLVAIVTGWAFVGMAGCTATPPGPGTRGATAQDAKSSQPAPASAPGESEEGQAQSGGASDPTAVEAEPQTPRWRDPKDGCVDLSKYLESPHGFLPVVMPITEPALGYGLVGGAVFLDPRESAGAEGWARPNITMLGGMWTEDGSEGLFGMNSSLWLDGRLQTLVGGGSLALDLELHGIGDDPALADDPIGYELDVDGVVGEGRARLGESDFWLALRLAYAEVEVEFDAPPGVVVGVDPSDDEVTMAGPTVGLRYDSLDNVFTPTRGLLSDTFVSVFDEAFGGSRDYQLVQQVLIHHQQLAPDWFLGLRGDANLSLGDTPFYARPYIDLRGIPALRYQGEYVASAQAELRWQFVPRYSLVGFGGGGVAWTDFDGFERSQDAFAGGLGLRYELARKFGLHAGLDVAAGPEEGAIYVVVGNSWLRP
jgi:hypothetical protein